MRVWICGGGVIGASIAYWLSLRQVEAVVVERVALAAGELVAARTCYRPVVRDG